MRHVRADRIAPPALLLALASCADPASQWFEPDWDRVIRETEYPDVDTSLVPRAEPQAPPSLPDLAAPGPLELSVEQAVVLALQRNRDLSVAQLTPVITGAFETIASGIYQPQIFAEAALAREEASEIDRGTGGQFGVSAEDTDLAAGVRQLLPTGTDIELAVSQAGDRSNRAPEQQSARVGLTITQALLRGLEPEANLAAVRQAELETEASRYELRAFVEALLADTEIAYWQHLLAKREIEIFERSLEIARRQAEEVDQRIEVGVLARTESAAVLSEIALREQALIGARSRLEASRLQILRLVNAPFEAAASRPIIATSDLAPTSEPLDDVEQRVELALRMRPDLNEARLRLDQNRLETIRTRNGLLPRLDLFLALGKTGYADTFPESFRELDGPTFDVTVGLSFSQYLGESVARGEYEASLATRQQAAASVRNLEQLVELDVRLAVNEAETARRQIDASVTTRRLQEQTVQAEIERFDVGASTTLLVAQAQRDLLVAQIAEVEAVTNYRIALVQLYLAEGALLERRGVAIRR